MTFGNSPYNTDPTKEGAMRRNSKTLQYIAMFITTLGVIFGMVSASEAFIEGEGERSSEKNQPDDPACANAIPLDDLRQIQIVAQGEFAGCASERQSRLLCSLEKAGLKTYDLGNIVRYIVARMPDGTCIRVNLQDSTLTSQAGEQLTPAEYLDPTLPMPAGRLNFGAMRSKRILYVRTEMDKCDPTQGGSLDKCEQERDALKIELHTLKSELGALKNASPSATAALPGQSPPTTAHPGRESGMAQSATGPSPPTTAAAANAAPEGDADLMAAALNQQGRDLTALKNALADCNNDSGKRVQINENGQPVCVATTATTATATATSPDSINILLGALMVLVLLLTTLFLFQKQKSGKYRKHLEDIRVFFNLDDTLPYGEFTQGIESLALRDQESLKLLHLLPIAQAMKIEDKVEIDTSPLATAARQLREKAEVAWKALADIATSVGAEFNPTSNMPKYTADATNVANTTATVMGERNSRTRALAEIRRELGCNGGDPIAFIASLRAKHTRDLKAVNDELSVARQQGDHSNCVPKDQHANCVPEFTYQAQSQVAGTLLAEKGQITNRYNEIASALLQAREGLQCLIDHPKAKPESKKGQRIKKAVEAILALIQSISAQGVPAPQAQA